MRSSLVLACILAVGCTPGKEREPPPQEADLEGEPNPAISEEEAPLSLIGEWRVAGVDGEAIEGPVGVAVSIDAERIVLAPCAGLHWRYRLEGANLTVARLSPDPKEPVSRVPEITSRTGDAIGSAESAVRTPENGIQISGNGRSVTLFSQ